MATLFVRRRTKGINSATGRALKPASGSVDKGIKASATRVCRRTFL